MSRVAIVGATGQLGRDLTTALTLSGRRVVPLGHERIEIADPGSVAAALDAAEPTLVINTAACQGAAAYGAEDQAAFFRVNALGPWHLARWCGERGVGLVHYSTDYVYGGQPDRRPLTEAVPPAPLNVYGASKLAGEQLVRATAPDHRILRVASLYGHGGCRAKNDGNFVETVLERAARGETLTMVDDQIMSPTATADIAAATLALIERDAPSGLYHCAGRGACSWYELACEIVRLEGLAAEIRPVATAADPPGAPFVRPRYAALDNAALRAAGVDDLPPWRDSLARYLTTRSVRPPMEIHA